MADHPNNAGTRPPGGEPPAELEAAPPQELDDDLSDHAENLTAASVSGGAWRAASTFGGAALQFGVAIVLARLLTPSDFGTVTLVAVVVGIANLLAFLGVGPALVRRKALTADYVATAWTLSLIAGVLGCVAIALLAPLLADLVGDASTRIVFLAVSPILVLTGLRTCSMSLLRRHMRFRALMVVDLVSYGLGYCLVAVVTALLGWGVWALVAGMLAQGALAGVIAYAYERHSLRMRLTRAAARDIVDFGGGVTASGLANYVALNGDNFIIGRTLGAGAVGLYNRAYMLMNLPVTYGALVLSQVLLPAFSRAQDDRERVSRGYLSSLYLVFTGATPMMMFMLVAAPYLIRTLFGPQWEASIAPLQVFALFGAFRAAYHLGSAVAQALGRPWAEFARQVLYALVVVAGALVGYRWGITGVAWGTSAGIVVMYVAMAQLSHSLLGFSWRSFVGAHATGLVCGLVVLAAGAAAAQALRGSGWPDLVVLLCLVVVCVGAACVAVSLLPRSWRVEGAERAMSVALGMLPSRLGAALTRLFRIPVTAALE